MLREFFTLQAPFVAYLWAGILTFTTYSLAGHMREQVCLYMCPWPRIQAALTDNEALNVTYRFDRGEPRMSVKEAAKAHAHGEPAGDCIDCMQCVAVCPTGVDIRKGSQLGCIQCGLCIDACDAVMTKVKRPTRLIAYDTDENRERRKRGENNVYQLIRPRTILYACADRADRRRHALCAADAHELAPERPARARAALHPDGRGRRPQRLHAALLEQAQRARPTSPSRSAASRALR